MTDKWFKNQGVLSVKELWVNIYPPLEDPLPSYDSVISVNRLLRLPAFGGDPHEGWCGGGEVKTPGYPLLKHS